MEYARSFTAWPSGGVHSTRSGSDDVSSMASKLSTSDATRRSELPLTSWAYTPSHRSPRWRYRKGSLSRVLSESHAMATLGTAWLGAGDRASVPRPSRQTRADGRSMRGLTALTRRPPEGDGLTFGRRPYGNARNPVAKTDPLASGGPFRSISVGYPSTCL